jgi:hypothetical protein
MTHVNRALGQVTQGSFGTLIIADLDELNLDGVRVMQSFSQPTDGSLYNSRRIVREYTICEHENVHWLYLAIGGRVDRFVQIVDNPTQNYIKFGGKGFRP